MNKIKILIALFGLILIPIIANLIFLLVYPFICFFSIFAEKEDFNESIRVFKEALAKF
jgi:hypothetical protein